MSEDTTHYRVTSTVFIDATTAREAARQALALQQNLTTYYVAFEVAPEDGSAPAVTVELYTATNTCRHLIPGVIFPAQANCDDTHEWVERCDTCQVHDTDDAAAAAVVEFYAGHGQGMVLGHARPFGVDHDCPYVQHDHSMPLPALSPSLVIARLEAAGWVEVAADLRDGASPDVVLARLAEDRECGDAAFLVNRLTGGRLRYLNDRQARAADAAYNALVKVHNAAVTARTVCLGAYHAPAGRAGIEVAA